MDRRYRVGALALAACVTLASLAPLGAQDDAHWRPLKFFLETPDELDRSITDDPAAIELRDIARRWTERAIAPTVDPTALVDAYATGDEGAVREALGVSRDEVAETGSRLVHLSAELSLRYPSVAGAVLAGRRLEPGDVVARLQHGIRRVRARVAELRRGKPKPATSAMEYDVAVEQGGVSIRSHGPWLPDPDLEALWGELEARIAPCAATPSIGAQAGGGGGGGGGGSWGGESLENCDEPTYFGALVLCALAGPTGYWVCAYVAYCSLCEGELRDVLCDGAPATTPLARSSALGLWRMPSTRRAALIR